MAIAFNIPSEREATEENFSRLNRLLAELYEVLCHILVARQPGQEAQETMRRDRPYSESDIDYPSSAPATSCRRSASSPPTNINLDAALDDDVFVSPRTDNGNDPFATRNIEIFGCGSPRTPAGVLLSPRRERQFTFSLSSEKQWRDKGGTEAAAAEESAATNDTDVTDGDAAPSSEDSHPPSVDAPRSIISTIFPSNVSSSICTAIILMLGWKLLSIKR